MGNAIEVKSIQGYQVRQAKQDELGYFLEKANEQQWNPALYDIFAVYKYDPASFYVGVFHNQIICIMSLVIYEHDFAFVGFVVCKPEYRGRLFAINLGKAISKRLSGQDVGLEAVFAQIPKYQKNGFKSVYTTIRYEFSGTNQKIDNKHILPLSKFDFNEVVEYDAQVFPSKRPNFLKEWINIKDSIAVGYQQNGKLVGFGQLRRSTNGYRIGPLYADDLKIVSQIIEHFRSLAGEQKINLDLPDINDKSAKLAELFSMKEVVRFSRMHTKGLPKLSYTKLYAVAAIEFG